eukprot:TRINITY_DN1766_c0_g1_i1.p1 TRINITY_DN1766_c0_g1~~TRINITY_DN1766_c0_g1_i1.p1  ORF type:complete len:530 (-),score=65.53 TRINITY_DN1766_c0_g1_i1:791-2380(-)
MGVGDCMFAKVKYRSRQHCIGMAFCHTLNQMVEIPDPAAGHNRNRDRISDRPNQLQIIAVARTVAVHRGDQQLPCPQIGHANGMFESINAGRGAAAMGEYFPTAICHPAGVDRGYHALAAETGRDIADHFGPRHSRAIDRDLVRSGHKQRPCIIGSAHAAADGHRHEADFRSAPDNIDDRIAIFVTGSDVEEAKLVGPGGIISLSLLDRITSVLQVDKIDTLDHTAIGDVKTGDDADTDGHARSAVRLERSRETFAPETNVSRLRSTRTELDRSTTVGHRNRGCQIQPAIIKRPTGDHAFYTVLGKLAEHMDIIQALDPAAGNHRNIDASRQIDRGFDIATSKHAVPANIGEQDRGNTCVLEPAGEIADADVRDIGPALGRDHAVARVDSNNDAAFIFFRHILDEIRVLERCGADHQPGDAQLKPAFDRLAIADTTAELDIAGKAGDDALYRFRILRRSGECTVKIDDVYMLGSGGGKHAGLFSRIIAIDGGTVHIAFGEAHDFARFEINGRKYNHFKSSVCGKLVKPW